MKFRSDLATLNRAIAVYEANAGDMSEMTSGDKVLWMLKSIASETTAKKTAGLRSSFVDGRLNARIQSEEEARKEGPRAYWSTETRRFYLANSGPPGIVAFELDEDLDSTELQTVDRVPALELATNDTWVWDYTDRTLEKTQIRQITNPTAFPPATPPTSPPTGSPSTPPVAGVLPLNPPDAFPGAGQYALSLFDLEVALSQTNLPETSRIVYALNSGAIQYENGSPVSVSPSFTITAWCESLDPSEWSDSEVVSFVYEAIPLDLQLGLTSSQVFYSYADLGGSFIDTSVWDRWAASQLPLPIISVSNEADIPVAYRNSDTIEICYTLDGSMPMGSNTAVVVPPFADAIPATPVPVQFRLWPGRSDDVTVRALARSLNEGLLKSAAAKSLLLKRDVMNLDSPILEVVYQNKNKANVSLNFADNSTTPTGARIYYTTDGRDPGDDYGIPQNGKEYTSSAVSLGVDETLIARVYPPEAFRYWFKPSAPVSVTFDYAGDDDCISFAVVKNSMTLDGTIVGSIRNLGSSGLNINGTTNVTGDIYLSGKPNVTINGTPDFSGVAEGTGPANPGSYTVFLNGGAQFGYLRTRSEPFAVPSVPAIPTVSGPNIAINSPQQVPANWFPNSGVNLNSNAGVITLPPGNYGHFNASNSSSNGRVILGRSDGAPSVYNFSSFTLNSGVPLDIIGPVTINAGDFRINAGSRVGNPDQQKWLKINVAGSQFIDNANGLLYAEQILIPNGTAYINGEVHASVMADNLIVNGSARLYVGDGACN